MTYRADIDGLRCLAVIVVILFHAQVPFLSGGFVGVDVFFVISGFLITSIIFGKAEQKTFSFLDFYTRRVRRIVPPLLPVLAFTFVFAILFLPVAERRDYLQSLIGVVTFTSNFVFLGQNGYFNAVDELKPLLHTWSLGIEEQYYLFFPLLFIVLFKFGKRKGVLAALGALTLLSLAANEFVLRSVGPDEAFYLTHLRIWEMLVGSLLAVLRLKPGKALANGLGVLGLILILASVFLYSPDLPFPGIAAIPPVLGSALVILGGTQEGTLAARVLSLKPVVYVGKISYGLYLWHWPLLIAVWVLFRDQPIMVAASVVATFLLSALSYHVWERPLRFGPLLQKPVIALSALAVVIVSTIGVGAFLINRYSNFDMRYQVFNPKEGQNWKRAIGSALQAMNWTAHDCQNTIPGAETSRTMCLDREPDKDTILLIGDSHAEHLIPGLRSRWPDSNIVRMTGSGCKPYQIERHASDECEAIADFIYNEYDEWSSADRIIISVRYTNEQRDDLIEALNWFSTKGPEVWYVGPTPEFKAEMVPLIGQRHSKQADFIKAIREELIEWDPRVIERLEVALPENIRYIDGLSILCPEGEECVLEDDLGWPLYLDSDHISVPGSVWFVERW